MVKNKKPVIGITMSYDKNGFVRTGTDYSFIRSEYGEEVRRAGGEPLFLSHVISPSVVAALCDGIVISGGEDIHPEFYGLSKTQDGVNEPFERTEWENRLIDACDEVGVKIFGICYGSQLLNVHYGGSLYQDIARELGSMLDHGSSANQATHEIVLEQDFLGFTKGDILPVAARHHQAVRELAPGFSVVARASDGVIEAITGRGHLGVQWHSESDGTAERMYGEFIKTCAMSAIRV